jgi:hypothetical protein
VEQCKLVEDDYRRLKFGNPGCPEIDVRSYRQNGKRETENVLICSRTPSTRLLVPGAPALGPLFALPLPNETSGTIGSLKCVDDLSAATAADEREDCSSVFPVPHPLQSPPQHKDLAHVSGLASSPRGPVLCRCKKGYTVESAAFF